IGCGSRVILAKFASNCEAGSEERYKVVPSSLSMLFQVRLCRRSIAATATTIRGMIQRRILVDILHLTRLTSTGYAQRADQGRLEWHRPTPSSPFNLLRARVNGWRAAARSATAIMMA